MKKVDKKPKFLRELHKALDHLYERLEEDAKIIKENGLLKTKKYSWQDGYRVVAKDKNFEEMSIYLSVKIKNG